MERSLHEIPSKAVYSASVLNPLFYPKYIYHFFRKHMIYNS